MIEQTVPKEFEEMAHVQQKAEAELFSKENVIGVALGNRYTGEEDTGEPAIQVLVRQKVAKELLSEADRIPRTIQKHRTDVLDVGEIFAGQGTLGPDIGTDLNFRLDPGLNDKEPDLLEPDEPNGEAPTWAPPLEERRELGRREEISVHQLRQRTRPVMGGFSVGHYRITAGTIGTCAYDLTPFPGIPNRYYLLSNNHVLANSNDARIGDPILQPGPYDGGTYPRDMIGRLGRFVPIRFRSGSQSPCNYVDAAIAEVPFHQASREIFWVGYVKDLYAAPRPGDILQKTGRTTDYSTGKVISVNATVDVNYGGGRVARFCRQIVTSAMSAPGDSGSLVTNLDEEGVGLLFAGSSRVTLMNNLLFVQSLLRIRIHEK